MIVIYSLKDVVVKMPRAELESATSSFSVKRSTNWAI